MFGFTVDFKCPYCDHEYQEYVWRGISHTYNDELYDEKVCPDCKETFLCDWQSYEKYIKIPEGFSIDEPHSFWAS